MRRRLEVLTQCIALTALCQSRHTTNGDSWHLSDIRCSVHFPCVMLLRDGWCGMEASFLLSIHWTTFTLHGTLQWHCFEGSTPQGVATVTPKTLKTKDYCVNARFFCSGLFSMTRSKIFQFLVLIQSRLFPRRGRKITWHFTFWI